MDKTLAICNVATTDRLIPAYRWPRHLRCWCDPMTAFR